MHKRLHRLCMLMVLVTLVTVPLAGGGSLFAGWAGRLAAAAALTGLGGLVLVSSPRPTIRWSLAASLLVVLLAMVAVQLPRLPRGLVGSVAPGRLDLQQSAEPAGARHGVPLSVDRARTRDAWMALAAASVMFIAVSQLANTRRRALLIAACLPLVLGLSALVGIVQEQPGDEAMFNRISLSRYDVHPDAGYDPTMPHDQGAGYGRLAPRGSMPVAQHPPAVPVVRYRGATDSRDDLLYLVPETATPDIFGTFTTSDSFGTWMLLAAPLVVGLLLALATTARRHYDNLMGCLTTRHGNLLVLLALACPLLGAVAVAYLPPLVSLLLLGQAVLLCLVSCLGCSLRRALPRLAVAVLLVAGAVVALSSIEPVPGQSLHRAVVLPRLAERMELTRLGTRAAVAMWRDAPWLGHGAGTFSRLYPLYAVGQVDRLLHYPHNAPAGWLAEVGLVGFALVSVALSVVLVRGVVGWFRTRDPWLAHLQAALLVAAIGGGLFCCVSAAAASPAVQLGFITVLALLWSCSSWRRRPEPIESDTTDIILPARSTCLPGGRIAGVALGVVLVLASVGLAAGTVACSVARRLDSELGALTTEGMTPELQWQAVAQSRPGLAVRGRAALDRASTLRWDSDLFGHLSRLTWQLAWPNDFASTDNFDAWIDSPPLRSEALVLASRARAACPLDLSALHAEAGLAALLQVDRSDSSPLQAADLDERRRRAEEALARLAPHHPLVGFRPVEGQHRAIDDDRLVHLLSAHDPALVALGLRLALASKTYRQLAPLIPGTVIAHQRAAAYLDLVRQVAESRREAEHAVQLGLARREAGTITPDELTSLALAHRMLGDTERALDCILHSVAARPRTDTLVLSASLCGEVALVTESAPRRMHLLERGHALLNRAEVRGADPTDVARLRQRLDSLSNSD